MISHRGQVVANHSRSFSGGLQLSHYARPSVLIIDEVGYLSYSNRAADLMFQLVSRRHEKVSTIITVPALNDSVRNVVCHRLN
jgi:DNA replication protein DnaC